MPQAVLKFNLPEEKQDHEDAIHGSDWRNVVWELDQYLRSKIKYTDENTPELFIETIQLVRDELWDMINEKQLNLEEL